MVIVFESKNLNLSHYIILDPCQVGYINAATELRDNSFLLRVGLWPLTQLAETDLAGSVHCAQEHDAALWEPDMPCCRPWDFLLSRLYLLCKSWLPFSILTNSRFFPLLIHWETCPCKLTSLYSKSKELADEFMLEARHLFFICLHFLFYFLKNISWSGQNFYLRLTVKPCHWCLNLN